MTESSEVAEWMTALGYACHGDTVSDMLAELVGQAVNKERTRCEGIMKIAHFGDIDLNFRSIARLIRSGDSLETIKAGK